MVDLPSTVPAGISPVDYLNWLSRVNYQQNQQQQTQQNALGGQQLQLFLQLLNQAQSRYEDARNANEQRRNEILQGRTDTRNRILDQWNGYGSSLVNDTNKDWNTNLNNKLAALSDSGLLQSTVNSSIRDQNEKQRQDAMRRVKDDIIGNYAGADERLSNNIDDFNERITDAYPNTAPIDAAAGQLGGMSGPSLPGIGGALGGALAGTNPGYSPLSPSKYGVSSTGAGGRINASPASPVIPSAASQLTGPRGYGGVLPRSATAPIGGRGYGWGRGVNQPITAPPASSPKYIPYGTPPVSAPAPPSASPPRLSVGLPGQTPITGNPATQSGYGGYNGLLFNPTGAAQAAPPMLHATPPGQHQYDKYGHQTDLPAPRSTPYSDRGVAQLPWNLGNAPGYNRDSQVQQMTAGNDGQPRPLYQPMPALGIFGAGVMEGESGGGYGDPAGGSYSGNGGYSGVGYSRTPLWAREPMEALKLQKQGLKPWEQLQHMQQPLQQLASNPAYAAALKMLFGT